jgi:hypothetical protein
VFFGGWGDFDYEERVLAYFFIFCSILYFFGICAFVNKEKEKNKYQLR